MLKPNRMEQSCSDKLVSIELPRSLSRQFLLLLIMLSVAAFGVAHTESIKEDIVNWNRDIVYLLPSKEICETGEDLWFKAYLIDGQTLALSGKSQSLYLQIRSETIQHMSRIM